MVNVQSCSLFSISIFYKITSVIIQDCSIQIDVRACVRACVAGPGGPQTLGLFHFIVFGGDIPNKT